jgi:hypothetical protein
LFNADDVVQPSIGQGHQGCLILVSKKRRIDQFDYLMIDYPIDETDFVLLHCVEDCCLGGCVLGGEVQLGGERE